MGDKSAIEWTDATWNPVVGCSVTSPGCKNCYAMKMAGRLDAMGVEHYRGLTRKVKGKAVWTGKTAEAPMHILKQPQHWKKPRRIFVNSMGDLFHDGVPWHWLDAVFTVMEKCPQHTFQVLTKNPERMRDYVRRFDVLPNVWLGVSVEDQRRANERIPALLETPAAVRFVSCEPLLGPLDLRNIQPHERYELDALTGYDFDQGTVGERLDWVIVGGESGPGARPMDPDWAHLLRDQCQAAGVPFMFKQWGPTKKAGQLLGGRKYLEFPQ